MKQKSRATQRKSYERVGAAMGGYPCANVHKGACDLRPALSYLCFDNAADDRDNCPYGPAHGERNARPNPKKSLEE